MADSVTYGAQFTRNMKDYESLKISVGFSSDVRDGETEEEAFTRVKEFVGAALFPEIDDVESQVRGVRTAAEQRLIDAAKEK